jgi:hypothetical protein
VPVQQWTNTLFAGFGGPSLYNLVVLVRSFWLFVLVSGLVPAADVVRAAENSVRDLYLRADNVISYQSDEAEHLLVFQSGFSMSAGAARFSSETAVVWLTDKGGEAAGGGGAGYRLEAYLEGAVSVKKGRADPSSDIVSTTIEKGKSIVVRLDVDGRVFVTADDREIADPRQSDLYQTALGVVRPVAPAPPAEPKEVEPEPPAEKLIEKVQAEPEEKFRYPIDLSPVGETPLDIERTVAPDGTGVATLIGRFNFSQKQEGGIPLELQADKTVIWYSQEPTGADEPPKAQDEDEGLAGGAIKAIYMAGDVVVTEGQRKIWADELYYDLEQKKALAIEAAMRTFDGTRGVPIYVRAAKLRQVAENQFAAKDIVLTTSEFHLPQISLNAASVLITDTTVVDEQQGRASDRSYDAQIRDIRMKYKNTTIFYWPFLRSNLERPDIPIKSVRIGRDSSLGTMVETRWHLWRLAGLREPEGTDSTLALDYYSKRGTGAGAQIRYSREDYFGNLLGYVINDRGQDDLGRADSRRNLEPPRELRGRFSWRHRHFLPHNWQLTSEISYLSDENFMEGFYRNEFHAGKDQETLVHLKRIEDNWGLSLLGKVRINDFATVVEELPSLEHHLTGQSLFEDMFTFYSDSRASRFRNRSPSGTMSEEFYTFVSERAELDMPLRLGNAKLVPFVAGTAAYEDGMGFLRNLGGSTAASADDIWIGELGTRLSTQYWKVYPQVKSQLWDLDGLRHIVRPHLAVSGFAESDSVAEQRDTLHLGISQRLQTKRGPINNDYDSRLKGATDANSRRVVDWMRLDLDVTWVNNSGDTSAGPDRLIWNKPFIPLVNTLSRTVPLQDRRSTDVFGPRRNYIGGDYMWRVSDTTAVLSDMNYDMQSGVVQQYNIGLSRLRWPNFSYYVGSRYLRRIQIGPEKGSNMVTFAATYVLDPRYTLVFSQQYDFDYRANVRSDIALIRRYHRVCMGLTYSADESLKEQAIVFSVWAEGVPELAMGQRRYMRVGGSSGY